MQQGIDIYALNLNDAQAPSWASIRQGGFSFILQKAAEWQADASFLARWPVFKANGFLRGAYFLPRPNTSTDFVRIDAQVDTFLGLVPRLVPGDFGPILDLEDRLLFNDSNPPQNAVYWLAASRRLLARMETALGRQPVIYTQRSWWVGYTNDAVGFDVYPLWVVDVNHTTAPLLAASWNTWAFWQWHWEQSTSPMPAPFRQGTDVGVDLDLFNGEMYELRGMADIGRPGVAFLAGSAAIAHSELDDHLHLLTTAGAAWIDTDLGQGALPGGGADPVLVESAGTLTLYFRSGDAVIEATASAATSWVWQATDLTLTSTVKPVHDPQAVADGDKRYVVYWGEDDDWYLLTFDGGWSSVGVLRDAHLGTSSGAPTVYARDGLPHVAGRIDADGHLWEVWPDLAGGWKSEDVTALALTNDPATPAATHTPCACQTSAGLLLAFRAVGGDVWLIDRTNNAPADLTIASGAVRSMGHPTCFVLNDVPHIVYRGIDGIIYELSNAGGGWQAQAICPDRMAADPVAASDGTTAAVAVRAPDGMIHLATFDGATWTCNPTVMATPQPGGTPVPDGGGGNSVG